MTYFLIIAFIYSLFKLVRIIMEMIGNQRCLDDETIRNYLRNTATQQERNLVIGHLSRCEKCQQNMMNSDKGSTLDEYLVDGKV